MTWLGNKQDPDLLVCLGELRQGQVDIERRLDSQDYSLKHQDECLDRLRDVVNKINSDMRFWNWMVGALAGVAAAVFILVAQHFVEKNFLNDDPPPPKPVVYAAH